MSDISFGSDATRCWSEKVRGLERNVIASSKQLSNWALLYFALHNNCVAVDVVRWICLLLRSTWSMSLAMREKGLHLQTILVPLTAAYSLLCLRL